MGGAQQCSTEVERPDEAEEVEIVSAKLWRCLHKDSRRAATLWSTVSPGGERARFPPTKAAPTGRGKIRRGDPRASSCCTSAAPDSWPSHGSGRGS